VDSSIIQKGRMAMKTVSKSKKNNGMGALAGAALAAAGMTQQIKMACASTVSPAASSPTVTYILSINDSGNGSYAANQFAIYAVDNSSSTNLGIANFSVNFTGYDAASITTGTGSAAVTYNTPQLMAPQATLLTHARKSYSLGFSSNQNLDPNNGYSAVQPQGGNATQVLVFGFGQTAGNLASAIAAKGLNITSPGGLQSNSGDVSWGTTIGNYTNAGLLVQGNYSTSTPKFTLDTTYDTAEVFNSNSGNGTVSGSVTVKEVTLGGNVSTHSALLTITNTGTASPAYSGTSNPGNTSGSSTITVVNTETGGYYVPGLLNKIGNATATNGAVKISGFVSNDTEIIGVALTVTDGNGTQAPSAQELTDIIADLNLTQSLPTGVIATVETFSALQTANPGAATLLTNTNSQDGGQTLELAVVLTGTGLTNPQTFGLNFTSETADGMTAVDVTDIAVVPEPASVSVLMLGGLPLLGRRRRKVKA